MEQLYADIAARTGGNIYIGVAGPVRTGKSTLIKRIMETLVIPGMDDPYRRERATDELPQSGSGKTITTGEPKFVPEEAAEICPDGTTRFRIRMIDTVGYMVDGAVGATEDGVPRMVDTPWFDHPVPMTEAAELGTKKVMEGHCSIGLVVTTDGSVTDIPREDYLSAEQRAITDMQATGKPFAVIVNTTDPGSAGAKEVADSIAARFGICPLILNCQKADTEQINQILQAVLYAFPMKTMKIYLPRWLDALEQDHPVKASLYHALLERGEQITTLGQAQEILTAPWESEQIADFTVRSTDPGTGTVSCAITLPESLFYRILSDKAGIPIDDDGQLLTLLSELSAVKQEYDKISQALSSVKATGYGIVMPGAEDMKLEKPELIRKNGACGVRLKAGAPSIHMIRVDVDTEICPTVGDEKQSRELAEQLSGEDPEALWESNIFGKSVYAMIQEGIHSKLIRTPEDVRTKFRGTLCRVVNDGANGLICLIL